jgi:uncharacterized protein YidB (DUF937 family)
VWRGKSAATSREGLTTGLLDNVFGSSVPSIVDKLTPNGRLPTEAEVSGSG